MPLASNVTVSQSDYVNLSIPITAEPIYSFEVGRRDFIRDDIGSLKEIVDRIDKLELEVEKLKQQLRGDIKL